MPPRVAHPLYVCLQVATPGISWPPSLPLSLGIPGQGASGGAGSWLPQCVSNPPPSPLKDLLINLPLACSFPKFLVADFVGPGNLQDLPEASVDEGLDFVQG